MIPLGHAKNVNIIAINAQQLPIVRNAKLDICRSPMIVKERIF
jgi:hypothetical protein